MYERELATFNRSLIDLLRNVGKFVVLKDDRIEGPYPSYQDALTAGYGKYGLDPFLVKKIEQPGTVYYFSRNLPCPR